MVRRILLAISVGLIALPEPVTTAVGIGLFLTTIVLFRHRPLRSFGNAEMLIQRSLKVTDSSGSGRFFTGTYWQQRSWFDNRRVSGAVVHHVIKTSIPQYEAPKDIHSHIGPWVSGKKETSSGTHMLTVGWTSRSAGSGPALPAYGKTGPFGTNSRILHHRLKAGLNDFKGG